MTLTIRLLPPQERTQLRRLHNRIVELTRDGRADRAAKVFKTAPAEYRAITFALVFLARL